jgi:opacity protein-like surface antigen
MNRLKPVQLVGLLTSLFLSSNLAHAQGFRVFAQAGGSFFQDERFFTHLFDRYRSNYATGGKITFGAEITPSSIIGLEGAYSYGRNNLRLTNLDQSQTTGYGAYSQRVSANLLLHSPIEFLGVRPYATGGIEYDRISPTSGAKTTAFTQGFAGQSVILGSNNKIGFNYGGGVELGFLPAILLRLDLRDHVTGSPTYGLSSSRYPISGAAHDVELSAGIVFHVGH